MRVCFHFCWVIIYFCLMPTLHILWIHILYITVAVVFSTFMDHFQGCIASDLVPWAPPCHNICVESAKLFLSQLHHWMEPSLKGDWCHSILGLNLVSSSAPQVSYGRPFLSMLEWSLTNWEACWFECSVPYDSQSSSLLGLSWCYSCIKSMVLPV